MVRGHHHERAVEHPQALHPAHEPPRARGPRSRSAAAAAAGCSRWRSGSRSRAPSRCPAAARRRPVALGDPRGDTDAGRAAAAGASCRRSAAPGGSTSRSGAGARDVRCAAARERRRRPRPRAPAVAGRTQGGGLLRANDAVAVTGEEVVDRARVVRCRWARCPAWATGRRGSPAPPSWSSRRRCGRWETTWPFPRAPRSPGSALRRSARRDAAGGPRGTRPARSSRRAARRGGVETSALARVEGRDRP